MTPRQKRLAMELRQYEAGTNTALIKVLKKAIVNVRSSISGKLAELGNAATNVKAREQAIQAAVDALEKMQESMSSHLKSITDVAARNAHDDATEELKESGRKGLVQYDPARSERYLSYLAPRNAERLAAVFTDKMQDNLVRTLRFAYIDVARKAAVEGLTHAEVNKELQDRWQKDSGNESLYRFVDKSGRAWENARYFQMLVRTNAQRVWNDSYCDSLASNGFKLARISEDGDPDCPICAAWEGRIVCVAGKQKGFPTYADAQEAGVFHPNCTHRTEYVDETIDADEIALQAKNPPSDMSQEAMQEQKDKIDVQREVQSGKSIDEAKAAVASGRLERHIRSGLFSDDLATVASQLPKETLTKMFENGLIPRFAVAKKEDEPWSKKRGTWLVPKGATPAQLKERLTQTAASAQPVKKPDPKPVPAVPDAKALAATARDGIKVRMKAAGFNPSFADALPDGVAISLPNVGFDRLKGAAKYFPSTKTVGVDPSDLWYGHESTFHHEMGHAFADTTGIKRGGTAENALVTGAMEVDSKAVLSKMPEIFGKNWKRVAANTKQNNLGKITAMSEHVFGKQAGLLDTEEKIVLGRILDSICTVTNGKYGYGHSKKYWSSMGPNIFADEMTANSMAAICAGDDKFKAFFGKSVESVEKIIKSTLDTEVSKMAK